MRLASFFHPEFGFLYRQAIFGLFFDVPHPFRDSDTKLSADGTRRPGAFPTKKAPSDGPSGSPLRTNEDSPPSHPSLGWTGSSRHRASARAGRPKARRFGARPSAACTHGQPRAHPGTASAGLGAQLTSVSRECRPRRASAKQGSSPPSGRNEQRHSVGTRHASARQALQKALGPDGKTTRRIGTRHASARQALQKALGPDGKTTRAAPGQPTPLGGAETHGGAPQTRRRSFGPARADANLTAPLRRSRQALFHGERQSRPRCTRSSFFGRTTPDGKTDQTGLAPESPQHHRGPK